MGFITITSDWGTRDHYLASVKAKIYGYFPNATIVDISHDVPAFDIGKTAYFLRNVYPNSPDGTVHIIGVDTIADKDRAHLIVCYQNQFFVGTDNGIFSLIFPDEPTEIYEITVMQDHDCFTFPCRDLFAKVAASLAMGTPPVELGTRAQIQNFSTPSFPITRYEKGSDGQIEYVEIVGEVTHIDRYENVNTNIHFSMFNKLQSEFKRFEISFGRRGSINKISTAYSDVKVSDVLALFASDGYLQIAMNKANAAGLQGIKKDTAIIVRFGN
ncbi:MAG: SAM-dependent chlorinase/fluorinase [Bacteroidales bacterium]|jgi:S-adenosylmethionine hydrolase|nr:SAM-dependent chlorinase/fluorinase [Bacteroidales bacterium]